MTTYAGHPEELQAASARIDLELHRRYPTEELRACLARGADSEANKRHKARIREILKARGERV